MIVVVVIIFVSVLVAVINAANIETVVVVTAFLSFMANCSHVVLFFFLLLLCFHIYLPSIHPATQHTYAKHMPSISPSFLLTPDDPLRHLRVLGRGGGLAHSGHVTLRISGVCLLLSRRPNGLLN